MASTVARVEVGARTVATSWGGIVAAHKVALSSGLVELIDSEFQLFKQPGRYKESDHVLAHIELCTPRLEYLFRVGFPDKLLFGGL